MRYLISVLFVSLLSVSTPALADDARIIVGAGSQLGVGSGEASFRYIAPEPVVWDLHPAVGVSVAGNGSGWVGVGAALTLGPNAEGLFLRITSMAGAYRQGNGRDLGGAIQFRNALDIGYRWDNGIEAGIGADHRSNAGLNTPNNGLNTVYAFASIPLK